MKCVICKQEMSHYGDDLHYCAYCELFSSTTPPDLLMYDRSYCEKYRRYETKSPDLNRMLQKARYDLVEGHTREWERARLLDFGCGSGAFLHYCEGNGVEAVGFDINPFGGFLDVAVLLGHYDVVTFWDVLEHLEDPLAVIRGLGADVIATCTPNSDESPVRLQDWRHYYPGEHVHYFNETSLRALFGACGYRVVEVSYVESDIRVGGGPKNILSMVGRRGG